MSREMAEENLRELKQELNLENLAFDAQDTCVISFDNKVVVHITWEKISDSIYLYSPILDGLPENEGALLELALALLEGAMLGGQMLGGGAGMSRKEDLVLIHTTVDMKDQYSLAKKLFIFVSIVEKWQDEVKAVLSKKRDDHGRPFSIAGGHNQRVIGEKTSTDKDLQRDTGGKRHPPRAPGSEGYIKI